jgi:RimJ/RimL family protein N-acetyltransferase
MPAAVRLSNVYRCSSVDFLYRVLQERLQDPSHNISHTHLPTRTEHTRFVHSRPYRAWYLIKIANSTIGHIWLNRQNEIGLTLLRDARRKGYEAAALLALLARHHPLPAIPSKRSGSFLANVAPNNKSLMRALRSLGARKIQCTYIFGPSRMPPPAPSATATE